MSAKQKMLIKECIKRAMNGEISTNQFIQCLRLIKEMK